MANNIMGGIKCATDKANSKIAPCAPQSAPELRLIRVPLSGASSAITEANIDAAGGIVAFLEGKFNEDVRSARWYFTPEISDKIANKSDATFATSGNRSETLLLRESVKNDYQFLGASYCTLKSLNNMFHNKQGQYGTMAWLSNEVLQAQVRRDAAVPNAYNMVGRKAQNFDVPMIDEATYTEAPIAHVMANYLRPKTDQLNTTSLNLEGLGMDQIFETAGVNSATLQLGAAPTVTGQFAFYVNGDCGQSLGLAEYYGALITAGVFKAVNGLTGAPLTILSATVNQTTGLVSIVLTTPPASTTPVLLSMQLPSVVFGIIGARYEVVTPLTVINP